MKRVLPILAVILTVMASCSGGKDLLLDKEPFLKIVNPTWMQIFPGQEDGQKSVVLILPYAVELESYKVDSVYFQGYHEKLTQSIMSGQKTYRVQIMTSDDHVAVEAPYELLEDEALVCYFDTEGARRYFKVAEIKKGESVFMP